MRFVYMVAKSRLKKVSNVRKKLHQFRGSPSQRLRQLKIDTVGKIRKGVQKAKTFIKKGMSQLPNRVNMNPKPSVQKAAIQNVQQLQAKVKRPPPISEPSPASLKAPSRPPPSPPSMVPTARTLPVATKTTIKPKVPQKPGFLKGKKLK
jgi:hypothetical protein